MATTKQTRVSQVIWNWSADREEDYKQDAPSLMAAGIGLLIGGIAAAILYYLGHHTMMVVVLIVSAAIFACALFFHRAYRFIQVSLQKFSFLVGQVLTWILLVPFFYLCFSVGRFFQKITGRDPMTRNWERERPSYWVNYKTAADKEQYKRQF